MLKSLGVAFEAKVVSAHRTPDLLFDYAASAALFPAARLEAFLAEQSATGLNMSLSEA